MAIASTRAVDENSMDQYICGPRCAKFVLDYFSPQNGVQLVELIRDMQWPDIDHGASISALASSLEHRGIYTKTISIAPVNCIRWPQPIILHCYNDGSDIGHYVVVMPDDDSEDVEVWTGLSGLQRMTKSELLKRASGMLILTSPRPIEADASDLPLWRLTTPINPLFAITNVVALLAILTFAYRNVRSAGIATGSANNSTKEVLS